MLAMVLSSPASDGVAESCNEVVESCWRRCCGVMLVMALLGQLSRGTM
jgi:hypothetical protein